LLLLQTSMSYSFCFCDTCNIWDLIIGISIPSSILLPTLLFTRSRDIPSPWPSHMLQHWMNLTEWAWWRVSNTPLGTPRGRYDEHNSKSSLSCETKVYRTSRRKPNFRRLMLASYATAPNNLYGASSRALLCTSNNVEPAHNTTKNFAPTYDEVVNLTGLL
jgi:hypothetical protein